MFDILSYKDITNNEVIRAYITNADLVLEAMGYTEHSFAHTGRTAAVAYDILTRLGYPERTAVLGQIAAHMHDIGNGINRVNHAHSGGIMAFKILTDLGMDPSEIGVVVSAIGHHDEHTAAAVNEVAAALILADKSDVRRSRVRNRNRNNFDIHDRVNYSVEKSSLVLDKEEQTITLSLTIDTEICAVVDYFEIFLDRMLLCRKAADYLGLSFKLLINDISLL